MRRVLALKMTVFKHICTDSADLYLFVKYSCAAKAKLLFVSPHLCKKSVFAKLPRSVLATLRRNIHAMIHSNSSLFN